MKRQQRTVFMFTAMIALVGGFIILAVLSYTLWYVTRPQPRSVTNQPLFEGITYTRVVERETPMIYHVVTIDLKAQGLSFLVTPPDDLDDFDYAARTTSAFLQEYGLQLAMNGDFFDPWRDYGPLNYYPHTGDGVNVRGLTVSQGQRVTTGYAASERVATAYFTADNRVSFDPPPQGYHNAISGNTMVLVNGKYNPELAPTAYLSKPHPRTALAVDESETVLLLVIVDGRQPNYSRGATLPQLATIILQHGGYNALNLDGGGSASLVIAGADGQPQVFNSTMHNRMPHRERPVANHLGIFAQPLSK